VPLIDCSRLTGQYMNPDQKHGNTKQDQIDYLGFLSKTARENNLIVGINNGGDMLKSEGTETILDGFDYIIVESCVSGGDLAAQPPWLIFQRQWKECDVYDPFLAAGKPIYQFEYDTSITTCPVARAGEHLVVYDGVLLDSSKITLIC
jgi:endo-alpha-1,4-polygalactosaminidase (GH114 family)